ncbi:hypothetical protein KY289_020244 [Solanum tuberosum]|nr:hypothetical protein KY289_020244 [Solanum tuberosum]
MYYSTLSPPRTAYLDANLHAASMDIKDLKQTPTQYRTPAIDAIQLSGMDPTEHTKKLGHSRGSEARKIASFDKWLLQIRDGSVYADNKKDLIHVPADVYIPTSHNQIESIVEAVSPSLLQNYNDPSYLKERAILTPKNEMVHALNEKILKLIPGEGRTYYSSDNVCKASVNTNEEDILYPTEFLNNLRFPGIPNHDIHLKVGSLIMLLRNLNQTEGLCNGTRLIITHLGIWSVTANIISGKNIGS